MSQDEVRRVQQNDAEPNGAQANDVQPNGATNPRRRSKGKKRGPKPCLDETKRDMARGMFLAGFSLRDVARHLGCAHSTLGRTIQRSPEFAEQVREAKLQCELDALGKIKAAGNKSWRASAWLLERTRPQQWEKATRKQPTLEQVANFWRRAGRKLTIGMPKDQARELLRRLAGMTVRFAEDAGLTPQQARELAPLPHSPPAPPPAPPPPPRVFANHCAMVGVRPLWEYFPRHDELPLLTRESLSLLRYFESCQRYDTRPVWSHARTAIVSGSEGRPNRNEMDKWEARFNDWEREFATAESAVAERDRAARELAAAAQAAMRAELAGEPPRASGVEQRQPQAGVEPPPEISDFRSRITNFKSGRPPLDSEISSPKSAIPAPQPPAEQFVESFERVAGTVSRGFWLLLPFVLCWSLLGSSARSSMAPALLLEARLANHVQQSAARENAGRQIRMRQKNELQKNEEQREEKRMLDGENAGRRSAFLNLRHLRNLRTNLKLNRPSHRIHPQITQISQMKNEVMPDQRRLPLCPQPSHFSVAHFSVLHPTLFGWHHPKPRPQTPDVCRGVD